MSEPSTNRNIRIEKSAVGSAIVSGDGNTIYVIHQNAASQRESVELKDSDQIGPNPYKGLAAFQAQDAANYFGREAQVERLWQRFQNLYEQSGRADSVPRFLPILGPSGCGKSSLARAGLVPELARRPLPGKDKMRVVVMVPGASPLKSLSGVLAKLTQDDQTPEVIKKRSYEEELRKSAASGRFDFWQDVAETLLDVQSVPLVVLVDQFEEIYSLCKDTDEREAFVENLLYAARSVTGYVTVVVTLRSDFLGETQRHKQLNRLFGSDQSMIVPAMTEAELRTAIAEPAKQAGHPFDAAIIDLLVKDAEGREGALPLLQFALTRIWAGLSEGTSPAETYREMGGVGGALARKAQDIYDNLSEDDQEITRRLFVGLVQLGEGTRDTRRRATIESLIASRDTPEKVQQVLTRFSSPAARLVSLSREEERETASVTHEALFEHWQLLNEWLEHSRDDIRFQRRLEDDADYWDEQNRPNGLLWRSPDLDLLKSFERKSRGDLSDLSIAFFEAANAADKRDRQLKRLGVIGLATGLVLTTALSLFSGYKVHQAARRQMELYQARAEDLADSNDIESMVNGLAAIGMGRSRFVKFPQPFGKPLVTTALLDEPNRRMKASHVVINPGAGAIAISADGERIITSSHQRGLLQNAGTLQVRDRQGTPIGSPLKSSLGMLTTIAIDAEGRTIVGASDGRLQIWNSQGEVLVEPFEAHEGNITSVAMSADGQSILSGSFDGTIRLWNREGQLISDAFSERGGVFAVGISPDGKTIIQGERGLKSAIQLRDRTGKSLSEPSEEGHQRYISALAISENGQTIVSGSEDRTIRLWDAQGRPIQTPFEGHTDRVTDVAITGDGQLILSSGNGSAKLWSQQGDSVGAINEGSLPVASVDMSADGKTILTSLVSASIQDPYGQGSALKIVNRQEKSFFDTSQISFGGQILSVAVSGDASIVAVAEQEGTVRLFDSEGKETSQPFKSGHSPGDTLTLSADGQTIYVAGLNGRIQRFNLQGELLNEISDQPQVGSAALSIDGQIMATTNKENFLQVWDAKGAPIGKPFKTDLEGFVEVKAIGLGGESILAIERGISRNGPLDRDFHQAQLLTKQGNAISQPFKIGPHCVMKCMAMSADGQTLVSTKTTFAGNDKDFVDDDPNDGKSFSRQIEKTELQLQDRQGNLIGEPFAETKDAIVAFAISADGKYIVSGGGLRDGAIRLWDREGNAIGEPFEGHAEPVTALAFSLDGKYIVSSGRDGTVKLWPVSLSEGGWVGQSCDRLKNYLPERSKTSDVAKEAKRTCDRYAWK